MEKTNEILTIEGERVEVGYESDYYEACDKCRFHNIFVGCNVRALCHGCPCEKYSDHENRRFAYFVDAEQPISIGVDTWFQQLKIGDKVETYDGRIETIRKKYDDSFMLGFDAEGRKNCAPDGYYPIAVSECRPFVDQSSSIAPDADLEAEIERWWNERYAKLKKDYKFAQMSGHYLDNETIIDLARHFAEWGAEHSKK